MINIRLILIKRKNKMSISKNKTLGWLKGTNNGKKYRRIHKDSNIYIKEYQGLTQGERFIKAAEISSDNNRCWWIREYIKYKPY